MIRAQTKDTPQLTPDPNARIAMHNARTLTAGESTAYITLNGMVYTLRITRAGKLILTK